MTDDKTCNENSDHLHQARRNFLKQTTVLTAIALTPAALIKAAGNEMDEKAAEYFEKVSLQIEVNGVPHKLSVEPRVTLLDLLREQLHLTGSKKVVIGDNAAPAPFM